MSTIGQLLVELGLDSAKFHSGVNEATDRAKGLGGVLSTALGTAAGFLTGGLIADGIGKIGEFLGESTTKAKEAQQAEAQLDAVLKSTSVSFGDATAKTVFHATSTAANASAVSMSAKEIKAHNAALEKAPAALETATAKMHDMEAAYAKAKTHTESATLALHNQQAKVAALTTTIQEGAAGIAATANVQGYWETIPGKVQITKDEVIKLSESLAGVTRNSEDEILTGQNMLLTFTNIGKDVFPDATKAMLNMATAMASGAKPSAEELKNTAIQLGKALNDPVKGATALQRVGVTLTEAQKEQIKGFVAVGDAASAQGVILKELNTEFGGSAEAAGKTAAGQADILGHSFEKMQEKVGGVLLSLQSKLMVTFGPFIVGLLQGFTNMLSSPIITQAIDAISSVLTTASKAVSDFVAGFSEGMAESGGNPLQGLIMGLEALAETTDIPIFNTLKQGLAAIRDVIPAVIGVFGDLFNRLGDGKTSISDLVSDFVSGLLQIVGIGENSANSIGSFLGDVIAAFQQVVQWVITNWPQIQATVVDVFNQIAGVVGPILESVAGIIRTVFGAVATFLQEHGAEIQAFIAGAWTKIQGIVAGVVEVIQATIVPMWQNIAKFLSDNQDTIKAVIELVWNAIKLTISNVLTIVDGIIQTFLKILKGDWKGAWDTIESTMKAVWKNITDFFGNIPEQLTAIGKSIIDGIVLGFNSAKNKVEEALSKIIMDAIQHIKDLLGIKSPSAVFHDMGANMMLGLANGISGFGALPQVQLNGVVNGLSAGGTSVSSTNSTTPTGAGTGSGSGQATVNVYLDGRLIEQVMGTILYGARSQTFGAQN